MNSIGTNHVASDSPSSASVTESIPAETALPSATPELSEKRAEPAFTKPELQDSALNLARRFFKDAAQRHHPPEYAMQLWLSGMRRNPYEMQAYEAFSQLAQNFRADAKGQIRPPANITDIFSGNRLACDDFLEAFCRYAVNPSNPKLAVEAALEGAKAEIAEPAFHLACKAVKLTQQAASKHQKGLYLQIAEAFRDVEAFSHAVQCAQQAFVLDRSDGEVEKLLRNLHAEVSIHQDPPDPGKSSASADTFADAAVIEDHTTQQEKAETDLAVQEVLDRVGDLLAKENREETLRAIELVKRLAQKTGDELLQEWAVHLKVDLERQELAALLEQRRENPDDPTLLAAFRAKWQSVLAFEVAEYKKWAAKHSDAATAQS